MAGELRRDYAPSPKRLTRQSRAFGGLTGAPTSVDERGAAHGARGRERAVRAAHGARRVRRIAVSFEGDSGGDSRCRTPREREARYHELMRAMHALEPFTGICYTQFTDMYQKAGGLLTMGQGLNFPLELRWATTSGQAFAGAASPVADEGPIAEREGAP